MALICACVCVCSTNDARYSNHRGATKRFILTSRPRKTQIISLFLRKRVLVVTGFGPAHFQKGFGVLRGSSSPLFLLSHFGLVRFVRLLHLLPTLFSAAKDLAVCLCFLDTNKINKMSNKNQTANQLRVYVDSEPRFFCLLPLAKQRDHGCVKNPLI